MTGPFTIAQRARRMPQSGIREIFAKAQTYDDLADLSIGEPNFATAEPIAERIAAAVGSGTTGYTRTVGRADLRAALAEKLDTVNDIAAAPDGELIVTPGAMGALYAATHVLCEPGAEVLVPDPYWPNYRGHLADAGATLVSVPTAAETGFVPSVEDIADAITDDTVGMILNTPSNPTGAVVPPDRLRAIGDLLVDRDLWAIVDETYEDLVYADATHHSLASDPALFDRTVTVHTFSKSYAMTGWRLGYATAPAEVISPMRVLQEHTVSCVAEPTQVAGLAALDHRGIVDEIHDELAGRRRLILDRLEGIDGVDPGDPRGAFYVFADVSDVTTDSLGFVDHLLETAQVGAIPGSVFGDAGEGFVRLSYATDRGTIETAMDGMATAVAEWD